ncbi:vacuolar protein 8-like isoform X2 [Astyanax mexicanus]|uniref:Vacuolar protein 8 n=2 Tax=Astyanax mexicanus TaxID=7994 RepID=A0A8T2MFH7_ASTMX|nr:vacuolar protein 8-like isoform X2 [Astyanax mexicanus]
MELCERCARLFKDVEALIKEETESFVQRVKGVAGRISKCCGWGKTSAVPHEKLYELLRRQHLKRESSSRLNHHLPTVQNRDSTVLLETCCTLLQSDDVEDQRTVTLSMLNLLIDRKVKEEHVIEMGLLEPLVDLLQSGDNTVQCHSSACIALLASSDSNREVIVASDAVLPLLVLARAFDPKVQQNAVRALLNLTKSENTVDVLCKEGVIPVLALLLQSTDSEVQFCSCYALSNIAAVPEHHTKMLQIGDRFLLKSLVLLMGSSVLKNSTQASQCLRSLTLNGEAHNQLVGLDWVCPLLTLLRAPEHTPPETALMLLSQLSAHPPKRESLVNQGVIPVLGDLLLTHLPNPTIVTHCTVTFNHLWDIVESLQVPLPIECLSGLLLALEFHWKEDDVVLSVLICLYSLACHDSLRFGLVEKMTTTHIGRLVVISSESKNVELSFAAGSLISKLDINDELLKLHHKAIVEYLMRFLRSQEVRFQQLAISSVSNLKKGGGLGRMVTRVDLEQELNRVQQQTEHTRQLLLMLRQDTLTMGKP